MESDKYIGTRLDGRYEIKELVGEGGMADVYSATDVKDNRKVAVKIMKSEFAGDEEYQKRFLNECRAISATSHPNIVKIFDFSSTAAAQYIVMEFIDGITLKDYIDDEKVLHWKDAVHFITQILRALQHAHNRGIVHRDVKPQNIMLLTDGTIKVMDFGIAKFAREAGAGITPNDKALGTAHYISPEQAKGEMADARSDLYSVGVMFYEMLTGRKPFDAENAISVALMHVQDTPARPRDINPNIPSGLEEIIMHAMEKDPAKRYQSAAEMIQDIEAFKNNNQIIFGYFNAPAPPAPPAREQTRYYDTTANELSHPRNNAVEEYSGGDDYYSSGGAAVQEQSKSLVVPILAAVTIVVVAAAIIIVAIVFNQSTDRGSSTTQEVPNVLGMLYDEAVLNYPYVKFSVEETEYTENYEENVIYKQSVQAGEFVRKDENDQIELAVAVSKGIQKVTVPSLERYTYEQAEETLTNLGLTVEQMKTESTVEENVEAGYVIRTDPVANTEVAVGSSVVVYVSQGIEQEQVNVPNFVGMTLKEAQDQAEELGFVLETEEADSEEEEGTVVEQDVEAGSVVVQGETITLTISTGEEPEGTVTYGIENLPDTMSGVYTLSFTTDEGIIGSYQFVAEALEDHAISTEVTGTGENTTVRVSISSTQTGRTALLGTYTFDFVNDHFTAQSEDFTAIEDVLPLETSETTVSETTMPTTTTAATHPTTQPATQPPTTRQTTTKAPATEPPTQPPTEAPTTETETVTVAAAEG